jgi:hypothetical protein
MTEAAHATGPRRIALPGFTVDLARAELRRESGAFVELRPRSPCSPAASAMSCRRRS